MLDWSSRDLNMKDAICKKTSQKHIIWSRYERLQVDVSVGRIGCFE
jgi:hypothetical protein